MMRNPRTHAEWQEAVDGAEIALKLHAANAYGLVSGGPTVNVDRCEDLLREGATRGVRPVVTDEKIRAFVDAWNAQVTA